VRGGGGLRAPKNTGQIGKTNGKRLQLSRAKREREEKVHRTMKKEENRSKYSRTQKGEEKKNWIVDASMKKDLSSKEENSALASAKRKQKNWTCCGNKIEHNHYQTTKSQTDFVLFAAQRKFWNFRTY
jgi:hypothetical protein